MTGGTITLHRLACDHCEPVARIAWPLRLVWVQTWAHAEDCPTIAEVCS